MESPVPVLENSVIRGARFLDSYDEKWFTKIDTSALRMWDGLKCICGQLFMKEFENALSQATEDEYCPDSGYDWALHNILSGESQAAKFGFVPEADVYERAFYSYWKVEGSSYPNSSIATKAYEILAILWVEQIEKRKAEAGLMGDM